MKFRAQRFRIDAASVTLVLAALMSGCSQDQPPPPLPPEETVIEYALKDPHYRNLASAKISIPVSRDTQPELWKELQELCARLRFKGDLLEVWLIGDSAYRFRTLDNSHEDTTCKHGYGARVVREPGRWVVIKTIGWIT